MRFRKSAEYSWWQQRGLQINTPVGYSWRIRVFHAKTISSKWWRWGRFRTFMVRVPLLADRYLELWRFRTSAMNNGAVQDDRFTEKATTVADQQLKRAEEEADSWDRMDGGWYWLEFYDRDRPAWYQFRAACLIQAPSKLSAICLARGTGISTRGSVTVEEMPSSWVEKVPQDLRSRSLSMGDIGMVHRQTGGLTALLRWLTRSGVPLLARRWLPSEGWSERANRD